MNAGSGVVEDAIVPFGSLFQIAFGVEGVVPNNEAITSLGLSDFAVQTASIFALGMVCNILLARFSRLKYIFLTGHHALYMSCLIAILMSIAGMSGVQLILPGAVLHFFRGATAGVCGNATGGLKGCVVGSFVHGVVATFLAAGLYPVLGQMGFANITFSDTDFTLVGIIFGNLMKVVNANTLSIIVVVLFLLPVLYNYTIGKKANAKAAD
ncbi:MAG: hypothetical protein LUC47_09995 [Clostridiales bacterium]|nr:hypothetical protein [Clostridiales bacterium]